MRLIDADALMWKSERFGEQRTYDNPLAKGVLAVTEEEIESAPTILDITEGSVEWISCLIDILNYKKKAISDILYKYLKNLYCSDCRYCEELRGAPACESCDRESMRWSISRNFADMIASEIVQLIK